MKFIDSFLNKITMYKLTLYYLIFLIIVSVVLSILGILSYNPLDILVSTFIAITVCSITNFIFAKIFKASTNIESVFITALILVLIIPVKFPLHATFIGAVSFIAMASKYLLTIEKRHIFNPAAVAVVAVTLFSPEHNATWWVGTLAMMPFVLIGGLLLTRKIQRESMVFSFLLTYLAIISIESVIRTGSLLSIISALKHSVIGSALLFFTFVMLTEPLTSPARKRLQKYYGYAVAFLYLTPQLRFVNFAITPEMALCIGNIFTYIINPNYRFSLSLKWKKQLSSDTLEFAFDKPLDFKFIPGQFMEWTLPHKKTDNRGNRRYFSIVSSPTEQIIKILVKFYSPSSSYKKELFNVLEGKEIIASQVSGDFTLSKDVKIPMVFIAGGVGIAPFISMIQYLIDKNIVMDIILIYSNRTDNEILYKDILERARQNGVKTIYVLTDKEHLPADWQGLSGHLNEDVIKTQIPDFSKRKFYISGPQLMVQSFEKILKKAGVKKKKIKTDFFPGYSENK
nr:RnfABCDGE type electron transport complex subunit D [Candidatus Levybacteria bacterium]